MNAQDLKNSILRLAVQGKLVEQRTEEGTARELLERIKAEKEQLIKDKKIKKEKTLPEIADDEIPFEIPESWEWVRLGECITLLSGQDMTSDKYNSEGLGIPYLTGASNISGEDVIINRWTNEPKAIAIRGNLLVTCKGTIGTTCILREKQVHIARQIMAITSLNVDIHYVHIFIRYYVGSLKKKAKSMIPGIERKDILQAIFPIPPMDEQKRIVAKIEEIFPHIELYGKKYTKLEKLNKKFPEDLKKSLLQFAVQGKLVEQCAEEGNAEELYQKIIAEKAELVRKGKIKKEKPLSEITEEEKPFGIPKNWKWVRIGKIGTLTRGKGIKRNELIDKGYPCIRYGELYTTYRVKFKETKSFVDKTLYEKSHKMIKGDVAMALTGENKIDIAMAVTYEGIIPIAIGGDMTCWSH
ncbi:MAG: restriction endonuclease subunit S, partial [Lachnospiraceae bacterium]|nr:restriction endonuclease subunit S [Lachnospiraceae bacterium]